MVGLYIGKISRFVFTLWRPIGFLLFHLPGFGGGLFKSWSSSSFPLLPLIKFLSTYYLFLLFHLPGFGGGVFKSWSSSFPLLPLIKFLSTYYLFLLLEQFTILWVCMLLFFAVVDLNGTFLITIRSVDSVFLLVAHIYFLNFFFVSLSFWLGLKWIAFLSFAGQ